MTTPSVRTRVGKYELGKTLGEGTFAKVKFAKHMETGAAVAIKVLDKDKILKHKMVEQVIVYRVFPLSSGIAGLVLFHFLALQLEI